MIVKKASCVNCNKVLILPDDVKPGDVVECCGVKQRVTYEYGAYALEVKGRAGHRGDLVKKEEG